jgi:hypothetical protein
MNLIKETLSYNFDKNNIYSCFYPKNMFIKYWSEIIYNLINTKTKILDAVYTSRKKFNIYNDIDKCNFDSDFIQYTSKILLIGFGLSLDEIKERYKDECEGVEERMFFRLELYSYGSEHYQIENYIYKNLLKKEKDFVWDNNLIAYYKMFINNISSYLKIKRNICVLKKGRPPLPIKLKEYIKDKTAIKVKSTMKDIYGKSKKFDTINKNLFTKDDINALSECVKDEKLMNKIKNLSIDIY